MNRIKKFIEQAFVIYRLFLFFFPDMEVIWTICKNISHPLYAPADIECTERAIPPLAGMIFLW